MNEISPINFYKLSQKAKLARIIDVRDIKEFEEYHINNSTNIPLALLCDKPTLYLNKRFKYYIICKNGSKSKIASEHLYSLGYNVINVIGGLNSMVESNLVSYYY